MWTYKVKLHLKLIFPLLQTDVVAEFEVCRSGRFDVDSIAFGSHGVDERDKLHLKFVSLCDCLAIKKNRNDCVTMARHCGELVQSLDRFV